MSSFTDEKRSWYFASCARCEQTKSLSWLRHYDSAMQYSYRGGERKLSTNGAVELLLQLLALAYLLLDDLSLVHELRDLRVV
jgi:hypothetical protein